MPEPVAAPSENPAFLSPLRRVRWAQVLVLAVLFAAPVIFCLHVAYASDPDVWWHLRSGEWILQHGAVPRTDPFSSFGAGKPWAAYSWLFELLIFQLFQRLGLVGIVVYTAVMAALITVAVHRLMRHLQADFSLAVLLTLAVSYGLIRSYTPRPWLFTILLFVLELDVLMRARKTGRMQGLLWLPPLFALWANLHIQFIDGLVVLAIAAAEAALAHWWTKIQTRLRPGWLCGVSLACILATLVNPYGWEIYQEAYKLAAQPGVLNTISELSAISFRNFNDWWVLLLTLAAVAALARERRFLFFESALLAFAIYVSFRSQRDAWAVVIVASAILAARLTGNPANRLRLTLPFVPLVAVVAGLAAWLGFCVFHINNSRLQAVLAENMPVRAVETARAKGWSGPLYNDYGWGGYLIWALRMPVSIDGRAALHGDAQINRSIGAWNGAPEWASDPDLRKARLVIGPPKAALTQLLRLDARFQLVYEDKVAAVFAARPATSVHSHL